MCEMKIASGIVNIFFVQKYSLDLMIVKCVMMNIRGDALLTAFCVRQTRNNGNTFHDHGIFLENAKTNVIDI